jgi:ubiquinone biosynthesis protein Coq4
MEEMNIDSLDMAIVAHEEGFDAIDRIMNYYTEMLLQAVAELSALVGEEPGEVIRKLEEALSLTGVMDSALGTLRATTQFAEALFEDEED